ncbi:50S ribosomal protein L4 [Sphaceloma murrayae]|uniref:50S ribosomal protein L4 n=1 Tax=Sphaceloma murrayae TaxID=2082308 RepID=A0A2K1R0L2_9PEZI|nr:50S ribosomal protein L4 [Sphaceloma murrayae]
MKATTVLSLLPLALAAPTPQDTTTTAPQPFFGLAIRSASPIQYAGVNASGLALWLNKPTATYCPSVPEVPCPSNPSTLFVGGQNTLGLDVSVPGGQQVYVAADGRAKYTQAHSANTGTGSATTGFSVVDGALLFEGASWTACPEETSYAVYAASRNVTAEGCLGFRWRAEDAGAAEGAWQYA